MICFQQESNFSLGYIFSLNLLQKSEESSNEPSNIFLPSDSYIFNAPSNPITAYSPLYEEKLAKDGISNLGTGFLLKKNVYIITKGKKNILNLLGQEDTEHLTYKAVDEIEASGNLFFAVYKVSRSVK